jgi:hypothetical protein
LGRVGGGPEPTEKKSVAAGGEGDDARKLRSAIRLFGLGERATLEEIKVRYRELVKRHHPDGGAAQDAEEIYRVNEANRVIMEYVESYRARPERDVLIFLNTACDLDGLLRVRVSSATCRALCGQLRMR